MKLTPEGIRKRAKEIATHGPCYCKAIDDGIIQLLEDATGEKVPEPFDEAKVRPLSVWRNEYFTVLFIQIWNCDSELIGVSLKYPTLTGALWADGGDHRRKPVSEVITFLKRYNYEYLGQYDFAAGLPKEAK
jgi:hypothetical protein